MISVEILNYNYASYWLSPVRKHQLIEVWNFSHWIKYAKSSSIRNASKFTGLFTANHFSWCFILFLWKCDHFYATRINYILEKTLLLVLLNTKVRKKQIAIRVILLISSKTCFVISWYLHHRVFRTFFCGIQIIRSFYFFFLCDECLI